MATIAIGDIHGNALALNDLLGKVLPTLENDDVLVFLGDYVDRGPDSRKCVERVLQLRKEAIHEVVTLLGNHEDCMLKSLLDPTSHSWLFGMEAFETIASYSADASDFLRREAEEAGLALVTEKVALPYQAFLDLLPPDHLAFLRELRLYHQTPDVLCVHAGVASDGSPLHLQGRDVFIWGPDGFPDSYRGEVPVVYGHWNNAAEDENGWPRPCAKGNRTFGIDTISYGVLTAMRFPDGAVFQSGCYRGGRLHS